MQLPPDVRARFRRYGREGGRERARRLSAAERSAIAKRAAVRRWVGERFGGRSFEELGLPGGGLVDAGLDDLAAGRETVDGLTVALAVRRLRREGVPVPAVRTPDADHHLYRLLEQAEGDLAHARYLARLRQIASFADACRSVRRRAERGAR